jgi:hypothetical protein
MPRLALFLVTLGLASILLTLVLVMGDAAMPARVPAFAAAILAGLGGVSLVSGLFMIEPVRRSPGRSVKA